MQNYLHLMRAILILCSLALALGCAKKELVMTEPAAGLGASQTAASVTPGSSATPNAADSKGEQAVSSVAPPAEDTTGTKAGQGAQNVQADQLATIYFDFDSWLLSGQTRDALVKNAQLLKRNPEAAITLEGHADERGSDAYNLALGEKRAKSALQYLSTLGIATERMAAVSYGEERPIVDGDDEASWAKNRRVEFVLRQ